VQAGRGNEDQLLGYGLQTERPITTRKRDLPFLRIFVCVAVMA
jgi:hypothetical protein